MRTKSGHYRHAAFVLLILMLFTLSGCGETYPIHDYEIDRDKHPGWHFYEGSQYVEHLEVSFSGTGLSGSDPAERATYLVFESSGAAKTYYKKCIKDCKDSEAEIYERGTNWFISHVPHTYDAEITRMYYLDQNVIICADVYIAMYNTLGDSDSINNSDMKEYILDNHGEMRESVMELFS